MVELADTRDLKSLGHCGRTGSSPVPGTAAGGDGEKTSIPLPVAVIAPLFFPSWKRGTPLWESFF